MKKILIATDGSGAATEAVDFGLELAAEHGADAVFVHVVPVLDVMGASPFGAMASPHQLSEHDREPLDEAARKAANQNVETSIELLSGNVVDEIVAYADSHAVDLIVVGSRGHGSVASTLLGSVSRGILRETKRPVLVVRGSKRKALAA